MEFSEVIKDRYSVRVYKDNPLDESVLTKILEAGRIAPTAANKQPVHIYVLQSEEALNKIRSLTSCAFNAPVVLMLTYKKSKDWKNPLEPGIHSGEQDVSIVATHIMLEAWNQGVGSCWVNYFPVSKTHEAFDLSDDEEIICLMPLGYASKKAQPTPSHKQSKTLEELLEIR